MNRIIYHYPLTITDYQIIKTHTLYKILDIKVVNNQLRIYCLVDPNSSIEKSVEIRILETGQHFDSETLKPTVQKTDFIEPIIYPWEYKGSHIIEEDWSKYPTKFIRHIWAKLYINK